MIKSILFDFDGTIADTAPGILNTMRKTYEEMGLPIPDAEAMKATIGLPLEEALQMLANLNDKDRDIAAATYRRLFPTCEATLITIFPGVPQTLKWLHDQGIRMAIVTSRGAPSLDMIMDRHGIGSYFETRVTHSDNLPAKPRPDMVLALLERMDIKAEETLVVGDTTFDIEMGNRAFCRTCAVTYGNHSRERLQTASPTYMVDKFEDIKKLI